MEFFSGTLVIAPIVPPTSSDVFATHLSTYGRGGFRTVPNLTERNLIKFERREDLMVVAVENNLPDSTGIAFYILDVNSVENPNNATNSLNDRLMDNNNWFLLDLGYGTSGGSSDTWTFPAPPTSNTTGTAGSRSFDGKYLYICVATDTWKRTAIDYFVDSGSPDTNLDLHLEGSVEVWENDDYVDRIVVKNVEAVAGGQTVTFTDNTTSFVPITNVDISYIRPINTKIGVGGLPTNSVVNFPTIQDALDAILYPFVPSTISISGVGSNLYEKGTTVSNKGVNYGLNINDGIVSSRSIYLNNVLENSPTINTGLYTSSTNINFTNAPVPNALYYLHQFKYEVTFSNSATISSVFNIEFAAPTYYGSLTNAQILDSITLEAAIKGLTSNIWKKSNRSNLGFTTTLSRFIYAFPAVYGPLVSVYDVNGFNITPSFNMITMNFTLADSSIESYNIYYNNSDTTLTGFNLSFNF